MTTPYIIRKSDVQDGTMLIADNGFTCMAENEVKQVKLDEHGLYVDCSEGKHYLDGQVKINDYDFIVGFLLY